MSKSQLSERHPTGARARLALAVSVVSLVVLAVVGPAAMAQTNSQGNGQPADSSKSPTAGATGNQTGPNVGGDTQAGNRSTPGNGGATGGGAGAPATTSDGSGGSSAVPYVIAAVLALAAVGVYVAGRQRRLDRAGVS